MFYSKKKKSNHKHDLETQAILQIVFYHPINLWKRKQNYLSFCFWNIESEHFFVICFLMEINSLNVSSILPWKTKKLTKSFSFSKFWRRASRSLTSLNNFKGKVNPSGKPPLSNSCCDVLSFLSIWMSRVRFSVVIMVAFSIRVSSFFSVADENSIMSA